MNKYLTQNIDIYLFLTLLIRIIYNIQKILNQNTSRIFSKFFFLHQIQQSSSSQVIYENLNPQKYHLNQIIKSQKELSLWKINFHNENPFTIQNTSIISSLLENQIHNQNLHPLLQIQLPIIRIINRKIFLVASISTCYQGLPILFQKRTQQNPIQLSYLLIDLRTDANRPTCIGQIDLPELMIILQSRQQHQKNMDTICLQHISSTILCHNDRYFLIVSKIEREHFKPIQQSNKLLLTLSIALIGQIFQQEYERIHKPKDIIFKSYDQNQCFEFFELQFLQCILNSKEYTSSIVSITLNTNLQLDFNYQDIIATVAINIQSIKLNNIQQNSSFRKSQFNVNLLNFGEDEIFYERLKLFFKIFNRFYLKSLSKGISQIQSDGGQQIVIQIIDQKCYSRGKQNEKKVEIFKKFKKIFCSMNRLKIFKF